MQSQGVRKACHAEAATYINHHGLGIYLQDAARSDILLAHDMPLATLSELDSDM
jgi:hypothetical protein